MGPFSSQEKGHTRHGINSKFKKTPKSKQTPSLSLPHPNKTKTKENEVRVPQIGKTKNKQNKKYDEEPSITLHSQYHLCSQGCSQEKYQPGSTFEGNLNSFLSSVVSSSSQVSYNGFAVGNGSSTPQEGTIYGLFQCRGDLRTIDCSKCIESAVNQISLVCPYSYGASLQLEGCYVRYEHMDFLGKIDTSLRYKKCSKSVSNDVEFFRRRDDVLADMESATGFRVGSSGLVGGFAQCLGDLSPTDCTSCLADAVGKLKSLCGSAAAADVFLAQCYAQYWASGYYDLSSDSSSEDQVGKTVAIIVGVLAGLAVMIVLLSFCRKAMG